MSHQIFLGVIDATGFDQQLAEIFVLGERLEGVGNSRSWEAFEYLKAITFQAGVPSHPKRRVHGERVDVRQKIARLVHDVDGRFAVRNSDVDVEAEDEIRPRELLHVPDDFFVALAFGDELIAPVRKRMRAGRSDPQPGFAGERSELAPELDDVFARMRDRRTNLGAQFDDRLVHLGLDLLFQQDLAALEDFLDVRPQLARLGIDDREFFLDAEGEGVVRGGHVKNKGDLLSRCHPEAGEARRGTSQALNRFRETIRPFRHGTLNVSRKRKFQLRGPSPSARLGMTR